MLCCLGDLVEDVVLRLDGDIAHGTDTDVTIVRRRGGSAANVAVAAGQAGCPSRFVGRIGADGVGAWLVDELERDGVEAVVQRQGRTGTIVVLVDAAGERSMLRDRAAAGQLDAVPDGALDNVTWLHVPAYSLAGEPLAGVALAAVAQVRAAGGSISVDASSVAVIEDMSDPTLGEVIRRIEPDVVFCNAQEAALLLAEPDRGVGGAVLTVVKDGPHPAVALTAGGVVATVAASTLPPDLDTTGAGDAFAGGFIAARLSGADIEDCLTDGHAAAARVMRTNHTNSEKGE